MSDQATLQDVAERAGVHRSTVSLALRDSSRISPEVRRRVQEVARELGYRVNPLVATLMQSRRTGRTLRNLCLAYVTNYPTRWGWRPPAHNRPDFFPGAARRAEELGYRLEHFWLGEPGMSPERFAGILATRAIHGVLLGRLPPGCHEIGFAWDRFAVVALGFTLRRPALHHVAEDAFTAGARATEECLARGYRRVGFVFSEPDDSPRMGDRLVGSFLRLQLRLPEEDRIPPCEYRADEPMAEVFARWRRRWRPDAIVATHGEPIREWLAAEGLQAPRDLGLAVLINDHPERGLSGIHHDPARVGALATDTLVGLLHRGEIGLPHEARFVVLPGTWIEGTTLRPRPA